MAPSATNSPSRQAPAQPGSADGSQFPKSSIEAANVSQVPLYSPLRYPGGKTWLIPHIKKWLLANSKPKTLIEPFAGGAIVTLTAVMKEWVDRAIIIERDPDVAAFWRAALHHGSELAERVREFRLTPESIRELEGATPHESSGSSRGFRTLVLNRTRRGGILAAGAASIRRGEDDKGIASRWYPDTLVSRLEAIRQHAGRIRFLERDSTAILDDLIKCEGADAAVFVDPPYTAGGRYAGRRLYTYNELDHESLFSMLADRRANVLMTYDASPEITKLIQRFSFHAVRVSMRTAHHYERTELVITRDRLFGKGGGDD